ncbi:AMP-activated serine/threonine-protein kinase regulatory subunit [Ascosphaera pollenicola]|nr:AMP-activated serine/threonine-protein kinase regulatory subunit [Ascosphaera pollenicola]
MSDSATPEIAPDHAQRNKEYWDKRGAEAFKAEWVAKLHSQMAEKLNRCSSWLSLSSANPQPKLLDYACGNGAATRLLRPYFDQITGIDIAPNMIEAFNEAFRDDAKVRGVAGDISSEDAAEIAKLSDKELFDFNFAIIVMGLHHVPDPAGTVRDLVSRVKVGGSVVVVDWLDDGHLLGGETTTHRSAEELAEAKKAVQTVTKHGFSHEELVDLFKRAGCEEEGIRIEVNEEPSEIPSRKGDPKFFIARGIKKA